jgi:hypothetical protein
MKTIKIDDIEYTLTPVKKDGYFKIKQSVELEVYPHDLPNTMTFLDAEKAVKALGNDWRIPTLEELRLIYKNKDEIGNFCTKPSSGSDFPAWYWSSPPHRDYTLTVGSVRFSDGTEHWGDKDYGRLSCRPVRLVAAQTSINACEVEEVTEDILKELYHFHAIKMANSPSTFVADFKKMYPNGIRIISEDKK